MYIQIKISLQAIFRLICRPFLFIYKHPSCFLLKQKLWVAWLWIFLMHFQMGLLGSSFVMWVRSMGLSISSGNWFWHSDLWSKLHLAGTITVKLEWHQWTERTKTRFGPFQPLFQREEGKTSLYLSYALSYSVSCITLHSSTNQCLLLHSNARIFLTRRLWIFKV